MSSFRPSEETEYNNNHKGLEPPRLEDIVYEMESRPAANGHPPGVGVGGGGGSESGVFSAEENSSTDIYAQLEQKERDLLLAAELGKALLDKNEELSRQNERIAEEFSVKLEVRHVGIWR